MVLALSGMGCTAHSDSLDVLQLLKVLSSAMVTLDVELLRGPASDCLQCFIRHHAMGHVVHHRCLPVAALDAGINNHEFSCADGCTLESCI